MVNNPQTEPGIMEVERLVSPGAQKLIHETADKVQFSNFIGERWDEKVCVPTLKQFAAHPEQAKFYLNLPENHEVDEIVALDSDPDIRKQAGRLKIPDTVMLEIDRNDPSYVTLRACDFKFNLNMAEYRQVSPRTLSELLVQSPLARQAVEAAINKLKETGKLTGEFNVADKAVIDQSQTEYLPLDEAKKIRGVTGRFISPDTEENRAYFSSGRRIRRENVLVRELTASEIDELLAGSPGQELASIVEPISDVTVSNLDRKLLLARVQAAMKAKNITTLEELKSFLDYQPKPE